mmetsp:Transcript_74951/g.126221  ORF Transcript_74951/g.126221 Transcript_74951/m.126221 type:complete len:210 (+) Transcript_74951:97-726(+)
MQHYIWYQMKMWSPQIRSIHHKKRTTGGGGAAGVCAGGRLCYSHGVFRQGMRGGGSTTGQGTRAGIELGQTAGTRACVTNIDVMAESHDELHERGAGDHRCCELVWGGGAGESGHGPTRSSVSELPRKMRPKHRPHNITSSTPVHTSADRLRSDKIQEGRRGATSNRDARTQHIPDPRCTPAGRHSAACRSARAQGRHSAEDLDGAVQA